MQTIMFYSGIIAYSLGIFMLIAMIWDFFSGSDKAGFGVVVFGIPSVVTLLFGGILMTIANFMGR